MNAVAGVNDPFYGLIAFCFVLEKNMVIVVLTRNFNN